MFSIIIPTYNRCFILWKAIQSVLSQSFEEWELIIVDDGSTDETWKLVREFLGDERIRYVKQENGGVCAARNRGMEEAQNGVIGFLDSDDTLYPSCLKEVAKHFENNPKANYVMAGYRRIAALYENGKLAQEQDQTPAEIVSLEKMCNWEQKGSIGTGFFQKNIYPTLKWNTELTLLENLDYLLNLAKLDPEGFSYLPKELCIYRQCYGEDGACSRADYNDWAEAFARIHALHPNHPFIKTPYSTRVEKYRERARLHAAGELPHPIQKYF